MQNVLIFAPGRRQRHDSCWPDGSTDRL